jgi:hypothetical protein
MMPRRRVVVAVVAVVPLLVGAGRADDDPATALDFHRVHVPAGRIGEVPLEAGRHVPMPLAEFEAAVARARAGREAAAAAPWPMAAAARYTASIDAQGRIVGSVAFDVPADTAADAGSLPLGGLQVRRATMLGDAGPRAAVVFGGPGGLAVRTPAAGTYTCEFTCPPLGGQGRVYRVPLVPALETTFDLALPPDRRPLLGGGASGTAVFATPGEAAAWRITSGPAAELVVSIVDRDRPAPRVAVWSTVAIRGSDAEFAAACVPTAPWHAGALVLEKSTTVRVTQAFAEHDGGREPLDFAALPDGGGVAVTVPARLEGSLVPITVRGVVPAAGVAAWRLPLVRTTAAAWAGGGSVVTIDPAWAAVAIDVESCRFVAPEATARWPLPGLDGVRRARSDAPTFHVEFQERTAGFAVTIAAHAPTFDVARVTTVEITPNTVLGRTACDVRLVHGEAFEVSARLAPGWIVDSVEQVVWPDAESGTEGFGPRPSDPGERGCEWRVDRGAEGNVLRIGLAVAATPDRGLGLRISGHRRGLPAGSTFTTSDVDMLRFDGEGADAAFIDFKLGSESFVEIGGEPVGWIPVEGRVAPLVEGGPLRGRIAGGGRATARQARVVRRRPPLDASAEVRLEPRDDVVRQTFSFTCRSEAGGVEAVVIDFAQPMGDGLQWSVAAPAGIGCAAQRIDAAETSGRAAGVAESWLVELTPAVETAVTIRAVRTVPFVTAVPFPLAWVDGAIAPGGTVSVGDAGAVRPRIRNRGLNELPADVAPGAVVGRSTEFAYGPPRAGPVAELVPAEPGGDARAWAWRETITCRCEESAAVESESRFRIENHGRESLTLTVPAGRRVDAILLDGSRIAGGDVGPAGAMVRIALPPERRRTELVVRTIATLDPRFGAWRVEPSGCSIDAPVLEREVLALLPPRLAVASGWPGSLSVEGTSKDWAARLFGLHPGRPADSGRAKPPVGGYREERFEPGGDPRTAGFVVVQRRLVASLAILAAAVAAAVAWTWSVPRPAAAVLVCVAAAVLALWAADPGDAIARAAWLAAAAAVALRRFTPLVLRLVRPSAAAAGRLGAAGCLALASLGAAVERASAAAPLRVFVTPGDGEAMALVPEPLFRVLAATQPSATAAIRILACRVTATDPGSEAAWRMLLDVDADAGGTLVLEQAAGARWLPSESPAATGLGVRIDPAGGERAWLTAPAAGRQRIELEVVPAVVRRGEVDVGGIRLPVAPVATLVAAARGPGAVACDLVDAAGLPRPAEALGGEDGRITFDVAGAAAVRLARPVDPRASFAAGIRAASSTNEIVWGPDDCRLEAAFDVDPGPDILRSFVVRFDGRCGPPTPLPPGPGAPRLQALGDGAVLVEPAEPARGPIRVRLAARTPLADAVGVFDLPGAWLDGVPDELRTVRVEPAADMAVDVDPPPPDGVPAAEIAGRAPAIVTAWRRRQEPRGVQNLRVAFAADRIGLELLAQIDTGGLALPRVVVDVPDGVVVDRVALAGDELDPAATRRSEAVDVAWSRVDAGRIVAVVQQPRAGRFRLAVDATLPRTPEPSGSLPLLRARLGGGAPLVVTWGGEPGVRVDVREAGAEAPVPGGIVEVPDGGAAPRYECVTVEPAAAKPADRAEDPVSSRVHRTEVFLAFDGRGRLHGGVRFDVSVADPVVRLRLPPGMRLYDLLVDGVEAVAEPGGTDSWDVRLHDSRWPRSLVALFAADLGSRITDGGPLQLAAPVIEGLSGPPPTWLLQPPRGSVIRVAEPARPLDDAALETVRAVARESLAEGFASAVSAATGPERDRLAALAELRRDGGSTPREAEWEGGLGWPAGGAGSRTANTAGVQAFSSPGPLTLRVATQPDPTSAARALATTALVAVGGIAWSVASRRRGAR